MTAKTCSEAESNKALKRFVIDISNEKFPMPRQNNGHHKYILQGIYRYLEVIWCTLDMDDILRYARLVNQFPV
jgi:hypothetical protein